MRYRDSLSNRIGVSTFDDGSASGVEAAAGAALGAIAMRLSEGQFRPFFDVAVEWAFSANYSANSANSAESAEVGEPSARRALSLLRVLSATQLQLGHLFKPFFTDTLVHVTAAIGRVSDADGAETAARGASRKRKRAGGTRGDGATDLALLIATCRYVEEGLGALGPAAPPADAPMRALEAALVRRLISAPNSPSADGTAPPVSGGATADAPAPSAATRALLSALGAVVRLIGACECKPLHLALCNATRDEREEARRGALRGLRAVYTELADAGLAYVPEALPYVSEMMEDGDDEVRALALGLARDLDAISSGKVNEAFMQMG